MRRILLTVLVLLLGPTWIGAGEVADSRFDFLKRLAGEWVASSGEGEMPGGTFEFRLTAGGTAIEEREMVGTPMEMVTVYHMSGKDLVATHYCMLGNQPRVIAARKVVDDTLAFSCNGTPGNAASHDEEHVHGWTMRLDAEGRLHYDVQIVKQGEVTEAPAFVLTRQTETAGR